MTSENYKDLTSKFCPALCQNIEEISVSSHDVLSSITSCSSKENNFLVAHKSDGMTETS